MFRPIQDAIGAPCLSPEEQDKFVYIDKKDGTGGFMVTMGDEGARGIVDEFLKDPEYTLRSTSNALEKEGDKGEEI